MGSVDGAAANWWNGVSASIAQQEYSATLTARGLQAPNRHQEIRTYFLDGAVEVVPRDAGENADWSFVWRTTAWGRPEKMRALGQERATPRADGARVSYEHDGIVEWYENKPEGLEQGFTIARRPAGDGPLYVRGSIAGASMARSNDAALELRDERGALVLSYGDLHAWGADGAALDARLEVAAGELAIRVDDSGAAYPLTIDPLLTTPSWAAESDQIQAWFGCSVSTAGDVNGDGYSDVVVGAERYDDGELNEGRAYLYLGGPGGLSLTPSWTADCDLAGAKFGYSVAAAGDVNGDGFADVIVGAPAFVSGLNGAGRVFAYYGSASGLSPTPSWTTDGVLQDMNLGWSVATAGDVNGDGFADVVIGSLRYTNGETEEGRAVVYHGSATGLADTAAWSVESNDPFAEFGWCVAGAGDVTGDGFADVVVGATGADAGGFSSGLAYLYVGSAGGLQTGAVWSAGVNQNTAFFGYSLAGAGDINGDGYADVIVGAPRFDNGQTDEGQAFAYLGSPIGLSFAPAWSAQGDQDLSEFAISVAAAGDINGDGYADVIVGATAYDNGEADEGRAKAYLGGASGLATSPIWTNESDQLGAQFGGSVAPAGDVNGDGYSDVIVGASLYDNGEANEGRAFVYNGSASGLAASPYWTKEANQAVAEFGYSVASAGDVNGDGFSDIIIGAPYFDNGEADEGRAFVFLADPLGDFNPAIIWTAEPNQAGAWFGASVASAGDVNGDGLSDVLVGAPSYDNGQTDEGRIYVYYATDEGLPATPSWTAESNQGNSRFGSAAAWAGDVNGDGYSDVIVGAQWYDNGQVNEGRVFVYVGSAAGLSATPAWIAESNQADAWFGYAVGTAGDVNRDGYSDVIVGSAKEDGGQVDEGRAHVFLGSAAGLAAAPAWSAGANQTNAWYGFSVGTSGDVNGDGYSDIVVGAPYYDGGSTDEGRALLYFGSASGVSAAPPWIAESDVASARFGASVGTAGDVDADGYSDLLVGAPGYSGGQALEGKAYVFHGGSSGVDTVPSWTSEPDILAAEFGFSAATAGDVNSDGFSDVIVGAHYIAGGEAQEGRVYVYLGNEGRGRFRVAQQRRTDNSGPVALLGRSDSESAIRMGVFARTPAGRARVRLQYEIKPASTPFNGVGLATGVATDTGPITVNGSGVSLSALATGLSSSTAYHWRARLLTNAPNFPWSPWFSVEGNSLTETDFRTSTDPTTAIASGSPSEGSILLEPVSPNPFRTEVGITFSLPARGRVRTAIFDVTGREVIELMNAEADAGRHVARWRGRDALGAPVAAGVYFARLEFGGVVEARKVVLAR